MVLALASIQALLSCASPEGLSCGAGTHQSGDQCVADRSGSSDSPPDSGETDSPTDSPTDSDTSESGGESADSGEAVEEVLDVYILAGQSNMDGYSLYTGLPPAWREGFEDVQLYWSGWGEFRGLAPASYGGTAYTGPEVAIGRTLADAGHHVAFVKHAVGGTDLYGYWYPGETRTEAGQGPGWVTLVTTMQGAAAELDASGVSWRWAGFVWMQGESDALLDYQAGAYAENLTRLLRRVREESSSPTLPAWIGLIACEDLCGYLDIVRAAQFEVADADPDVTTVETLDLTRNIYDPWHYDGPGGRQLGARFAEAILGEASEAPVSAALKVQGYSTDYDGNYTVGWVYSLDAAVTLTDVGGFAPYGALLGTSSEVGVWDADTQELILREEVPSWYEAPTTWRDGFFYTAIDPVRLEPGNYVIGLTAWYGDADSYANDAVTEAGDGIAVTGAAYHTGEWLAYPESQFASDSGSVSFLGPSFLYVAG